MKKFGFTLTEVLITMAVIGIVAALSLPSLNNALPDRNKAKTLKAYSVLSSICKDLIENQSLYPGDPDDFIDDDDCEGFYCRNIPYDWSNILKSKYTSITNANVSNYRTSLRGDNKFVNLVGLNMELKTQPLANRLFQIPSVREGGGNFQTKDGLTWIIRSRRIMYNGKQEYLSIVTIDTDTSDGSPNCTYSNNCSRPDRYSFLVRQHGSVIPNDPLTKAYIDNPKNLRDRQADVEKAAGNLDGNWINF